MKVLFEIMVQIKQKRGIGVENPSPRSFSGGVENSLYIESICRELSMAMYCRDLSIFLAIKSSPTFLHALP